MRWQILICTVEGRETFYNHIVGKLKAQIKEAGLDSQVSILSCKDKKGEYTIGAKRTLLLEEATADYISFVDDDDDVSEDYISRQYEALELNTDCLDFYGIITIDGGKPQKFIHALGYESYFEVNGVYYRPPNHLNCIKRELVKDFKFAESNFGEDTDWAMRICNAHILKTTVPMIEPLYYYRYVSRKAY